MKRFFVLAGVFTVGVIVGVVVMLVFGSAVGCADGRDRVVTRRVTVVERDTVVTREPVLVAARVTGADVVATGRRVVDEVTGDCVVADSTRVCMMNSDDSVRVALVREQRVFEGESFRAWVSGVDPCLDSVAIVKDEVAVDVPVVQMRRCAGSRWGVSIGAGVVAGISGRVQPGLMIGISYRLFPN